MKILVKDKKFTVIQNGKFILISDNNNKAILIDTKPKDIDTKANEWEIHIEGQLEELPKAKCNKSFKLTGVNQWKLQLKVIW